jgi:hypothetical protein
MELHRFFSNYPTRAELFRAWNASKRLGEIPTSWSFARHGWIGRTWSGWTLFANA